ncbi:hypothetical protein P9314_05260 [Paenibacillus validus]|uniref:hypothetical protein n=1 Tax=Paenibacillus validus TaxID=44253 RepID=UPI000FDBE8E8|nr:hypothetical protein [Paenibacillus validus]MED4600118.1 hypothetical protein [Paenibacillus validus]MED4605565.1 hypothetical protein [Paenibacillus validus]
MMEMLPQINFFDADRMGQFFQFLFVALAFIMPLVLVWAAIESAGDLIRVIRRVFAPRDEKRQPDQERYDIKYKDYNGR